MEKMITDTPLTTSATDLDYILMQLDSMSKTFNELEGILFRMQNDGMLIVA